VHIAWVARSAIGFLALAAIKHDQLAIEAANNDFSRITVIAALILPFAGLQLAFDIDLAAFAQKPLSDTDKPITGQSNAMPFGALFRLTSLLVFPAFRSG
jgi:hypothetical protein